MLSTIRIACCATVAFAITCRMFLFPSHPQITLDAVQSDKSLHGSFKSICHIHHRLVTTYPQQPTKSLFEYLGVNANIPLFADHDWLVPGEKANADAHDAIIKAWAVRQERLQSGQRRFKEEEGLSSAVAAMLTDHKLMGVYMEVFMPQFSKADRLGALKSICQEEWADED